MKKLMILIVLMIALSTFALANDGIIHTGGRSAPVSNETDRQTVESVESGYFSQIAEFFEKLFR